MTTIENRPKQLHDGDTFEHEGRMFKFELKADDGMGEPWKEHDGHGIVSDWTRASKKPGELVLFTDRYESRRYYNVAETLKIAKRDGWGANEKGTKEREAKLGRTLTAKEKT